MNTNAKFVFEGDSAGMERAYKTGNKLVEELIRSVASMTPAYSNADKAADALLKRNNELERSAGRLRASLVTPQSEYKAAIDLANQALNAQLISEAEYAMAIDKATDALTKQTTVIDPLVAKAAQIKAALVTPQQEHKAAIELANQALAKKLLTEDEYAAAVARANAALAKQTTVIDPLVAKASQLKASLVTPQQEYKAAIDLANQALNAEMISEAQYEMAVNDAKAALEAKDVSLQKVLNDAARIKASAVTPEQAHADAIARAKAALDKKLITQKEYDNELRRQNELLAKAKVAQNDFGDSTSSMAGQFATELTGIGGVLGIVAGAASLLRTELTELREAQKTSAEKQLDTAASERKALLALGDDPQMTPEMLSLEGDRISLKRGISKKQFYDSAANALSSKLKLSSKAAIEAVDVANEISPHEGASELAGTVLDLQNRYGGNADQVMGMIIAGQQVSRVKDQASYAMNVAPTIKNLGIYGDTIEQATALTGGMSNSMTDLMGRQSSTAMESLAKQLAEALPTEKTGLKNTTERIQYFWDPKNDRQREKYFGNKKTGKKGEFSFEAGAYGAINELVSSGDNKTKQDYMAAVAGVPQFGDAATYYNKAISRVSRQPLQIQSSYDRQHKVAAEQGSLSNLEGGRNAIAREGLDSALKQSGEGYMSRWWTARKMDYNDITGMESPTEFSAREIRKKADRLAAGNNYEGTIIGPTADELRTSQALLSVAEKLEALNGTVSQNSDQTVKNTATPVKVKPQKPNDGFSGLPPELAPPPENTAAEPPAPAVTSNVKYNDSKDRAAAEELNANLRQLAQRMKDNTEATRQATEKPPPVVVAKVARPVNQPNKPRPSQALAAPSQLS